MDVARDADGGAPAGERIDAARGVARPGRPARDAARAVHLLLPDGAGPCARPRHGERAAARGHRGPATRRARATGERRAHASHHRGDQGSRHLHARCRRAHRHLESGRDRAHRLPRPGSAGPRFRAALPARRRAAAGGNAHRRRARRLDCRRMLAPAQGRQPLPRRRHDLGHPRQRRRAGRIFGGDPRCDAADRAAGSDRALARLLLFPVFGHSQPRVALRRERRLRLCQQRVARLHGAHARGGARRRLEGRHPSGRSRGMAEGIRPRARTAACRSSSSSGCAATGADGARSSAPGGPITT